MTIAQKQKELVGALQGLKTAQDRLAWLVRRGRLHPPLDPAFKTEAHRVEGCLAKVWFVPEFAGGRCHFRIDSNSAVVKGIAVLLCEFYSGHTPEEIIETSPAFLEQFGITQHLTPNRRNSLAAISNTIHAFAQKHSEKP
jgi:cysteine desulfuration protein SufE